MSEAGEGTAAAAKQRRQALYLHIGLPKSGTTFLQSLLAGNRDRLRQAGLIYPFVRPEGMFHAAVELRGQHREWGLAPELVDGTWQELLDRVGGFDGDGIISHELLAGARRDLVERVAHDTGGLDLHVVVTARDLSRQAVAHWQEQVKNGRRWSFATFQAELFGPGESESEEDGFWRSQDLLSVLRRWGAVVPPEQLHLVIVPTSGADPMELWRRFAGSLGVDPHGFELDVPDRANESLGCAQVALLRQVLAALDDRLEQPHRAHLVKRLLAQTHLSAIDSPRPVTPPGLLTELRGIALRWVDEIAELGVDVNGRLDELVPAPAPAEKAPRHPDDVSAEEMLEGVPKVIAELLVEIAELRSEVAANSGRPAEPQSPTRRRLRLARRR